MQSRLATNHAWVTCETRLLPLNGKRLCLVQSLTASGRDSTSLEHRLARNTLMIVRLLSLSSRSGLQAMKQESRGDNIPAARGGCVAGWVGGGLGDCVQSDASDAQVRLIGMLQRTARQVAEGGVYSVVLMV